MKKAIFSLIILTLLAFSPRLVSAETETSNNIPEEALMPAKEASDSAMIGDEMMLEAKDINSFEYFWPVVAGKTLGDRFYSLKLFKEKLQGALIFNKASKAEYYSFLATKRLVEAEKLINEDKSDLVSASLDAAKRNIEKSKELSQKALAINIAFGEKGPLMVDRMDKLSTFSAWLSVKHGDYSQKLEEIIKVATETKTTLQ